ncbi:Hsp70 family protein [Dactylosporangium sp. AC04546]|uniref:Hsp70 family protein n=1 Tax=Dactylosporangium sp. AC04546 TaxID=2862460 RepID=UPI001EE14A92|nr:Hsp70 family protein [Dactylosporangium sp. AC04546]WVK89586.1 Hsp70 family protein [Dactylosporangium sp. AC04546]
MLGIDFGTSSTVAVVGLDAGRSVPLLFGETPLLPSAVCVAPGGELIVGRDAVRASRSRPEAFEAHPKSRIDDGEVLLGERAVPVTELIGAVLRRVHDEAVRVAGAAVDRLVLTHPAGWGAHRRQTLTEAAAVAGLPAAVFVAEPVAAAAYYVHVLGHSIPSGKCVVVYDFGAGTFDASVVRRTGDGFEVLAEQGLPDTGGLDVDAAIVAHLGAVYGVRDPEAWRRLTAPATAADRRTSRTFWDDVRTGKEELSRAAMTTIFVPILDLDAVLGREQLDHLARPLLDRTVTATRLATRTAGIRTEDVAAVFLVGGSSRMSLSATLLHRSLGVAPAVIEQPELIVAGGTLHVPAGHWPDGDEASTPIPEGLGRPRATTETIAAPHAVEGQPGTPTEIVTPTAPARRRRLLLAAIATAAVLLAVVLIVMQSAPPGSGPAAAQSSGKAPTSQARSTAASTVLTPTAAATPIATLGDHKGEVTAVAFSPDRKTMATGGLDDEVMVWDVTNPAALTHIATLAGQQDWVSEVTFSPDGKTMATAAMDDTVMVWDMANPAAPSRIATLTDHKHWVYAAEFSPVGKTMATAGGDHTVMLWSMANPAAPKRIATLTDDNYEDTTAVAFSPDGRTLATAGAENTVVLWSMANPAGLKRIATLTDYKHKVTAVAFSPDGKTMTTAGDDYTVVVWNVADPAAPKREATLPDQTGTVMTVAFSPDGKTMATGGADRRVTVWSMADPATPTRIAGLTGHSGTVNSVAFSPDGRTLAAANADHTAILWRLPAA